MCREGMSFVRIGMEAHKVEESLAYLESALAVCDTVYLNLMKTSVSAKSRLTDLLRNVPREIAGVYVVDSFGSMLPSDVKDYVEVLRGEFDVVGFHGHDNLGLANANSLEAITAGARIIDGTLCGIGRGSGNAMTEVIAGILTRDGKGEYDFRAVARMAEFCRRNMKMHANDRFMQVLGGVIGVHTSLFPVIEKICSEFMVDAVALMERATARSHHDLEEKDLVAAARELTQTKSPLDTNPNNTMVNT
jgi:4-hydroxy 2-oxovalerate aldolase